MQGNYSEALMKTVVPKATRVSPKNLELKQKRYAARAADYSKAVSKNNGVPTPVISQKPKPLPLKGCAKPRRVRAHHSPRAHKTQATQVSAPSSGSGGSDGPRPRTPRKTRVYIGSARVDPMHEAMSLNAIEQAMRVFPGCEILHRQMFSNLDQLAANLSNIDVAIFIPYRSPVGRDRYKKFERDAILAGNPNALILTAEADGTFAATSLKPALRKSQAPTTEENCKKAFLYFVNGRTEADAACCGRLSPGEFKKFLNALPDYARAGQVRTMAVYTADGEDFEAYVAGPDLVAANSYAELIEKINSGEAAPRELGRFEGERLQALKMGKRGFIKDKIINLCGDFSKISEHRAVRSSPKHDLEKRRFVHYSDGE